MAEAWPEGFGVTMGEGRVFKQTGWLFVITAGDCVNNMVQLTCETEGLGTFTWEGSAQQFQREFRPVED